MLLPRNMGRLLNCANGDVYAFKTLSLIASFAMYKKYNCTFSCLTTWICQGIIKVVSYKEANMLKCCSHLGLIKLTNLIGHFIYLEW
jgi:hypothetical protein